MSKTLLISFLLLPSLAHAQLSCHIHPPDSKLNSDSAQTPIGTFANLKMCEKENHQLFQLKGRCHCRFFQPSMPFLEKPQL